jgi:hypothetical protein
MIILKYKMSGYKPPHWSAAYFNDPIERCQHAQKNYYPHTRYSPYVNPNFHNEDFHRADMPYFHGSPCGCNSSSCTKNKGPTIPDAMSAYSGWVVSLFK